MNFKKNERVKCICDADCNLKGVIYQVTEAKVVVLWDGGSIDNYNYEQTALLEKDILYNSPLMKALS
jgi:hypothetical protein